VTAVPSMKAMLEPRMVAAKTHLPFGAWGEPSSSLESGPADVILIGMDTVRCGHDIRRCHSGPIWSTGTLEAQVHSSRVVGDPEVEQCVDDISCWQIAKSLIKRQRIAPSRVLNEC
jgi:hypothetical protein